MANNKNGRNGKGKNGVPHWVMEWFHKLNDITMELEESNRDNKKRINLAEKRIEQNEEANKKTLARLENFNKIVAKKLGVGYTA